jgi:hypothetical protein
VTRVTQASKRKTTKSESTGGKTRSGTRTQKRLSAEDEALELAKARERARQRSGSDD